MKGRSISLFLSCHVLRRPSRFSFLKELITRVNFSQIFVRNYFLLLLPNTWQIWSVLFSSREYFDWRLFVYSCFEAWCVDEILALVFEKVIVFWGVFGQIFCKLFWTWFLVFSFVFFFIDLRFFLYSGSKWRRDFKARVLGFNVT